LKKKRAPLLRSFQELLFLPSVRHGGQEMPLTNGRRGFSCGVE
jgi:hypothetical protein